MKKLKPATSGAPARNENEGSSRREFLAGGAGAAAGAAMIFGTPKVASIAIRGAGSSAPVEQEAVLTKPSGATPREPVTAYVRDGRRGEVTVLFGTQEKTYRDPALVRRLLKAAK